MRLRVNVRVRACVCRLYVVYVLLEAASHASISARRLFVNKYPAVPIAIYSFIQLIDLKHCSQFDSKGFEPRLS